jgi:Phytanoyl-CoA dioxygenase (PhyH)
MGFFKRRGQATAVPLDELIDEIRRLTEVNRATPDRETERRLLRLRHEAGIQLLGDGAPAFPAPDAVALPDGPGLPEFTRDQLTPELLRAGILRDGCVLVRGLIDREAALAFAGEIDRSFAERERMQAGAAPEPGYYEEMEPEPGFDVASVRPWVQEGGGVLATDAPKLTFEMLELFERAGLRELVGGYLGEAPLLSMHKTTLRKAEPTVGGAWHQDGAFMHDVRALNLWLSLSRCGDESPGLDIVPRRLEEIVIDHDAMLVVDLTRQKAEEAARGVGIVRPIFEPGDALFFDELFLHQTGSDPSMPKPRFAVESWFFGGSAFPADYAPVAV